MTFSIISLTIYTIIYITIFAIVYKSLIDITNNDKEYEIVMKVLRNRMK